MLRFSRFFVAITTFAAAITVTDLSAQVTFSAQTYTLNNTPRFVVSGDLNGDGKPDLIVSSWDGGIVSVLLNHGDGTFSAPVDFPGTPNFILGIAVGDFNGDKKLDVLALDTGNSSTGASAGLYVLFGNGDGTLQSPISTSLPFQSDFFLAVSDFNGDGLADAVVHGPGDIVPLLSNGDGTFTIGNPVTPDGFPILLFDVNGDGKPDLVFGGANSNGNALLLSALSNGDGTFATPTQSSPVTGIGPEVAAGDFRHSGTFDIVSGSHQQYSCPLGACRPIGGPGAISISFANSNSTFNPETQVATGDYGFVIPGDYDGDGNLDVLAFGYQYAPIVHRSSSPSVIVLGNGRGGFSPATQWPYGHPLSGIAADLNGDGLADVAFITGSLQVLLNTTPGFSLVASAQGSPISPGGSAAYTVNVGQFNGLSSAVALSCVAPQAVGIKCSLSPSSVAPGSTSTLTVTTTGQMGGTINPSVAAQYRWLYALWLPLGMVMFGGITGSDERSSKRKVLSVVLACILVAGVIFQAACSEGTTHTGGGTPSGKYAINVTGAGGALQRSTSVSLTVQ